MKPGRGQAPSAGRNAARAAADAGAASNGLVVATHGRHCVVEDAYGGRRLCHGRGKKSETVVGDHVFWATAGDEGVVETTLRDIQVLDELDAVRPQLGKQQA